MAAIQAVAGSLRLPSVSIVTNEKQAPSIGIM